MSSNRSKLKLDEESFEALLGAAYTVQEHRAKLKRAAAEQVPCSQCGNPLEPEHQFCGHCGTRRDEFRPGERMQRKWASLWMMSQKQGDTPDFEATQSGVALTSDQPHIEDLPDSLLAPTWSENAALPATGAIQARGDEIQARENDALDIHESLLLPSGEDPEIDPGEASNDAGLESSQKWNWRLILRFHRADLYLALAILVSAIALSWVIWSAPVTPGVANSARLSLWDRTLVKAGIAEAPAPPVRYRGNPNAKVWADPHTALYYCGGDEQFGKTHGGHVSTQREAQMDRFAPAARIPCE
jgi:hypothetical protein